MENKKFHEENNWQGALDNTVREIFAKYIEEYEILENAVTRTLTRGSVDLYRIYNHSLKVDHKYPYVTLTKLIAIDEEEEKEVLLELEFIDNGEKGKSLCVIKDDKHRVAKEEDIVSAVYKTYKDVFS